LIAALDMGGTKLSAGLVEAERVVEYRLVPTPKDRRPEAVMEAMLGLLQPFLPRAKALGVAATGTVRNGKVTAPNQQTLPWTEVDLQGLLHASTGRPTFVLNDADAAAWGEAVWGAGRGVSNFIFVTVSTGVGSGLVLNGRLYQGCELGFTRVGGRFLEHAASGKALDEWAKARGWPGAREVVSRALTDAEAEAKFQESASLIADKLADLRVILGLERAVIGGGLGLNEGYIERLRSHIARLGSMYALEVVPAALGADAGLIGAAIWALRQMEAYMADTDVG